MSRIRSKQIKGEYPLKPNDIVNKEYVDNKISSVSDKRKLAYFHAMSNKMLSSTQNVHETLYKSSHNITYDDIWSDEIGYADTYADALIEANTNDAVTLFENVQLLEMPNSNNESYCYFHNSIFIKSWISPIDVPLFGTLNPSNGYKVKLYKENGSEVLTTEGDWSVDYYAGIINFSIGFTPIDLGWGNITVTFFQYSGAKGIPTKITNTYNTVKFDNTTSKLTFNDDSINETIIDLSYLNNDYVYKTVEFNTHTNVLTFNESTPSETTVNLSALKQNDGKIAKYNNIPALNTSYLSPQASIVTLSNHLNESLVMVFVNGIQINVGDNDSDECYFSRDNGITAIESGYEMNGDVLYWNYINNKPVIGYELTTFDILSFLYQNSNTIY